VQHIPDFHDGIFGKSLAEVKHFCSTNENDEAPKGLGASGFGRHYARDHTPTNQNHVR
jgi:hypothetical protein